MVLQICSLSSWRSNRYKTFSTRGIKDFNFAFRLNGYVAALKIENFQNPLVEAFRHDFNKISQFHTYQDKFRKQIDVTQLFLKFSLQRFEEKTN